ncbi:MAG TPA: dienelactone hydrolase family protein [Gemmatimonadales bacterium]|nr:dienelactone hydrolase family protein [Gemmatimonadales bacterium]
MNPQTTQMFTRMTLMGAALILGACSPARDDAGSAGDSTAATAQAVETIAPGAEEAASQLAASTRHGEWATIPVTGGDSVRAWVVYPERPDSAPVVVVIHEIFGLTTWVRSVADQLAADGYIAIAPDLLTGHGMPMAPDSFMVVEGGIDSAIAMVSRLEQDEVIRRIGAAGEWGVALPAAADKWGVVGFCWGGSTVLAYAALSGGAGASAVVSYYGGIQQDQADMSRTTVPTLALYGGDDARVNATRSYVEESFRAAEVPFESETYEGAGHGFLRQQSGQDGANQRAANAAWPRMLGWFEKYL